LEGAFRELAAFGVNLRDWRQLEPSEVTRRLDKQEGSESRTLLATAIFAGTAQACMMGRFMAPHCNYPDAVEVDCGHLGRPISRLYLNGRQPQLTLPQGDKNCPVDLECFPRCHPLDACVRERHLDHRRHAIVRFSARGDPRNTSTKYTHLWEDQLFLRTSYYQSFEKMEVDITPCISDALDAGGLIYTPGVPVLRGPLQEGALWLTEPPRVDVLWVALEPRPLLAEQGQYAKEQERRDMECMLNMIFTCAAANQVDTLVLPALGCGTHGCCHPHLDMADLIHSVSQKYQRYISRVRVASDHPAHNDNDWWENFAHAVRTGRPSIQRPVQVPVPPFPRTPKDSAALAEKARLLQQGRSARRQQHTFL